MLPKEWYCNCCSRISRTLCSSVNVEPMSRVTSDMKASDVGLETKAQRVVVVIDEAECRRHRVAIVLTKS